MKLAVVLVCVFLYLVILGMVFTMYILFNQYWTNVYNRYGITITSSNNNNRRQVQYYLEPLDAYGLSEGTNNSTINFHGEPKNSLLRRGSKSSSITAKRKQKAEENEKRLLAKINKHKNQLMIQLRRVLHDESNVFKTTKVGGNPYNVVYTVPRGTTYDKKSARELICSLKKKANVRIISENDEPFKSLGVGVHFSKSEFLGGQKAYDTCAIVSSAGSLYGSELGKTIDKHDLVLRFNHAPTREHDLDVGHKTTVRIVNSQVISKPPFKFLDSPLYRDIDILAWDPAKYNHSLEQWYENPDYDFFKNYFEHRLLNPETGLFLLDPRSLWRLWEFIQSHMPLRIRRNPPSSGFLGLALLLSKCNFVDMFEFVPSLRMTKRCHYYEERKDQSCTFGVWHPLAAEKLLLYAMNIANDTTVFHDGYVRIPGYTTLGC